MRRVLLLGAIFLGLAGSAQARGLATGGALLRSAEETTYQCPSYQEWQLVDNASLGSRFDAKLKRALADQSVQLSEAWGTPCAHWGDSGWYLYLEPNVTGFGGHFAPGDTVGTAFFPRAVCRRRLDPTQACAEVTRGGANTTLDASHEFLETIVDPTDQGYEVCDPVQDESYLLDGVWVSDWVEPGHQHDFLHVYGAAHIASHQDE